MLTIRRDSEIFEADGEWFHARWHFSFDHYRDPDQMGVGPLRVFNDDRIVAGADWPMHPHQDIESLTYVVEGHFEHADSLGNNGRLRPRACGRGCSSASTRPPTALGGGFRSWARPARTASICPRTPGCW